MLVLTRRKGESINIGDNIKITVVSLSGDSVRIGIEASKDIPVYREEIYLKIQAVKNFNQAADKTATTLG